MGSGVTYMYNGTSLVWTPKKVSLLVRCPMLGVIVYTHRVLGTAECVLFIDVSSFQDVVNKRFHCSPREY